MATVGLEIGLSLVLDEASHGGGAHAGQMPTRHLSAGAGARSFNCDERYVHLFKPSLASSSEGVNFYYFANVFRLSFSRYFSDFQMCLLFDACLTTSAVVDVEHVKRYCFTHG